MVGLASQAHFDLALYRRLIHDHHSRFLNWNASVIRRIQQVSLMKEWLREMAS